MSMIISTVVEDFEARFARLGEASRVCIDFGRDISDTRQYELDAQDHRRRKQRPKYGEYCTTNIYIALINIRHG